MKKNNRKAFTMIELIFVIVILGILSSVAISKMAVTRDDAVAAKGRSQVSAIRNTIALKRNTNMLMGQGAKYPARLDALSTTTSADDGAPLLDYDTNKSISDNKLLDYPIYSKTKGGWHKTAQFKYAYNVQNTDVNFTYTPATGNFDCNHNVKLCKQLTE